MVKRLRKKYKTIYENKKQQEEGLRKAKEAIQKNEAERALSIVQEIINELDSDVEEREEF